MSVSPRRRKFQLLFLWLLSWAGVVSGFCIPTTARVAFSKTGSPQRRSSAVGGTAQEAEKDNHDALSLSVKERTTVSSSATRSQDDTEESAESEALAARSFVSGLWNAASDKNAKESYKAGRVMVSKGSWGFAVQSAVVQFWKSVRTVAMGGRAQNQATRLRVGDVVVPLANDLEKRGTMAAMGIYPGVEYVVERLQLHPENKNVTSLQDVSDWDTDGVEATAWVRPAYPLRAHLERDDWPVPVNPRRDVPLWLTNVNFHMGTAIGTLYLALTNLAVFAFLATFVRITYVPSESMTPALHPGDVVLVTKSIWPLDQLQVGQVALFDPPRPLLEQALVQRSTLKDGLSALPAPGQQLIKRIVAVPGERVGVAQSNPLVESHERRIDRIGPYASPTVFADECWERPLQELGPHDYFVAGDNGARSVDSRVWGPLPRSYIYGVARWKLYPQWGPIPPGPLETTTMTETTTKTLQESQ